MFAEQLLRMIAGLLVGVWVARYLGPEQFGIFSYATAFVAIFSSVAKLGLDSIVVQKLLNEPENIIVYLGTAFWLKIAGGLIAIGTVSFATLFTNNSSITSIYILIIASGIVFQSFEVIDFYFQSKVRSKFVSISKSIQLLISSLVKICLVLINADLFWFFIVSMIDQAVLALALFFAHRSQKLTSFYQQFDLSIASNMLKESWPLFLSSIVYIIYIRLDQILINNMLGANALGIYAASLKFTEVWLFVPLLITNSLFPAIVLAKQQSIDLYNSRLQRLYALLVWIAILIVVPIFIFSESIIANFYGSVYKDAAMLLRIHSITLIFIFLWMGAAQPIIAESRFLFAFFRNALGLFVNVVSNLILIPKFGITGAAVSSLLSFMSSSAIANLLYKPMRLTFFMQLKTLIFPIYYVRKLNG